MKKLPIGKQDFASLIQEGFLYIDKTEHIHRLLNAGSYLFLSRPRRFGKSLLLSIAKEIFEGNRKLFKGLWIEDKIAWERYPVIYIDFNRMNYRTNPLDVELDAEMDRNAHRNGIQLYSTDYKGKFSELLETLGGTGRKAVVLIDEYDKAITDFLGEDETRLRDNVRTLKNFYGTLKSLDRCIHFSLITGVSKYGKVSIFSDLNNLKDITLHRDFSVLLGITQEELEQNFSEYLQLAARELNFSMKRLLKVLRDHYNGYSWDGKNRVYNPFSILNFCSARLIQNYWFSTGTPTMLTDLLLQQQIPAYELERLSADDALLETADIQHTGLYALLFQTGYLTIKKMSLRNGRPQYLLSYPNGEVHDAFLQHILSAYVRRPVDVTYADLTYRFRQTLEEGDLPAFFNYLSSVFSSVPYQITRTDEAYFHSIVHVILSLTGFVVHSEIPTNQGRMDAVLDTGKHVFIFEFKLRENADAALAQIRERGYPERFRASGRTLTLVGVAFDTEQKNVREWKTEEG